MKRKPLSLIAGLSISLLLGIVVIALAVDAVMPPPEPRLQAVTARVLDEAFRPIEPTGVFTPTDVFYLSVRVEHVPAGSIVSARWRYGDSVIITDDQVVGGSDPVHVVGFELRRTNQPWPAGEYSVDVLLDGELQGTPMFSVVADAR